MFLKFHNLFAIFILTIILKRHFASGQTSNEQASNEEVDPDSSEVDKTIPKSFLTGEDPFEENSEAGQNDQNEQPTANQEAGTPNQESDHPSNYELAPPGAHEDQPSDQTADQPSNYQSEQSNDQKEESNPADFKSSQDPYLNQLYSTDPYLNNERLPEPNPYGNQAVLRQFQFFPLVPVQPKNIAQLNYDYQHSYQNYHPMLYQQQLMFHQHYLNNQNQANGFRNFFPQQTITYEPVMEEKDHFKGNRRQMNSNRL